MTRVLMIEDNKSVASIVEGYLAGQMNALEFIHAPTLAIANNVLTRKSFDIILLDVELPDGNGLAWLQSNKVIARRHYPVIVLSSSEKIRTVFAAMNAGAYKYLDKSMASVAALPAMIAGISGSTAAHVSHAA